MNTKKYTKIFTKILTLLTIFVLLVPAAMSVGSPSPKPFTVNFVTTIIDTSFSVQTKTSQLNFTSYPNTNNVAPVGGNPWGNIANEGNIPLNFTVKLDTQPSNIVLKIGSSDGSTGGGPNDLIQVLNIAASPLGWKNVAVGNKKDIVAVADYVSSSAGLQTRQITIESIQS